MTVIRNAFGWLALLTFAAPLAAQMPVAPVAPAAPQVSLVDGYVLGPGDILEVSVLGREDFKPRVQVQTDGTIALPLIGTVVARNRTVLGLRDQIRQQLVGGGYFAKPEISIFIVTYASRYVTVLGEVGTPGVVPVDRVYRLSEIIARAGGVRSVGADTVTLTTEAGQSRELSINAIATGVGGEDPVVNPGDKVFVAPAKTFYIYGQVSAPGIYPIDPELSIRRALARGGGLTALGSEKRIELFRDGKKFKKVDLDEKIRPGDTIVVGERFF